VAPSDYSLVVDHEERASGLADLLLVGTILSRDNSFRLEICKDGEVELPVLNEGKVGPDIVDGNGEEFCVELFEFWHYHRVQ